MALRNYKALLLVALGLVFLAAAADGLIETLLHHYPAFTSRFPSTNPYWWNPALSWENKGDGLLTRTALAMVTDAYHCFRFVSRALLAASCILLGLASPKPFSWVWWRVWVPTLAAAMLAWSAGFYLVWDWIF